MRNPVLFLGILSVLAAACLVPADAAATPKTLYMIEDHRDYPTTPIAAYSIFGNIVVYQDKVDVPSYSRGPVGLALDDETKMLFVTYEASETIQLVDAEKMEYVSAVIAPNANDMAGIVFDQEKNRLYAVDRYTDDLYVYSWDGVALTFIEKVDLINVYQAHGIALAEEYDVLFVGDNTCDVKLFHTNDWSPAVPSSITFTQEVIGIELYVSHPDTIFVYTGNARKTEDGLLLRYNFSVPGQDRETNISNLTGFDDDTVIGIAVDKSTGFVYVSTGNANTGGGSDKIVVFDPDLNLLYYDFVDGNPCDIVIPDSTSVEPRKNTHQELFANTSGDTVYDMLLVIDPGLGGFPLADVIKSEPFPECSTWVHDPDGFYYLHWSGDTVFPGDTVQACFETYDLNSGGKKPTYDSQWFIESKYWTDENHDTLGLSAPSPNLGWKIVECSLTVQASNQWLHWNGDGWPPDPGDSTTNPVGSISGTEVFWAVMDSALTMQELDFDIISDPGITWYPLPDFVIDYGDSVDLNLGTGFSAGDVALVRFAASGQGLSSLEIFQVPLPLIEQSGPTAIHLVSFSAHARDDHVEVTWVTASELNTAGFNVYRSAERNGARIKLNEFLIPARGSAFEGAEYAFMDKHAAGGYFWFEDVSLSGGSTVHGPVSVVLGDIPAVFSLAQNFPNPFNPATKIKYSLPRDCHVELVIYNVLGQRIQVLVDERQKAGYKSAVWDGTNSNGVAVSSGMYFYKIKADDFMETKKMLLLR
jgi:DNA-binding beta-propeller fold protein YncE